MWAPGASRRTAWRLTSTAVAAGCCAFTPTRARGVNCVATREAARTTAHSSSPARSMAARPSPPSGRGPTRAEIASYLEENALLLEAILEKQNTGRLHEAVHYQLQLQQNLIYLATHADERDDIQPLNFQPTHAAGGAPAAPAQPPASSETTRGAGPSSSQHR